MKHRAARVLTPLLLVAAGSVLVACSKDEPSDSAKASWTCSRVEVPMGEVVRCVAAARSGVPTMAAKVTTQGKKTPPSSTDSSGSDSTSGGGSSSDGSCDSTDPSCFDTGGESSPPESAPPTDEATSDDGSSSRCYECTGADGEECPNDSPAPPAEGNSAPGPDECSQVEDLPYCKADAPPPPPPKGGWTCTEDMADGQRTCDSPPSCSPGTHASKCGACVMDGEADDCVPPSEGGCWITGGGFIVEPSIVPDAPADGHDNFGGNAKQMKRGTIQGHWNHVDHGTQNHAKGRPDYIYCRHVDEPGPGQPGGKKGFTMNQIYFGGPAEWRSDGSWASGYWFDVVAKDHGEPGSQPSPKNGFMVDTYHFTLRKMDDPARKTSGEKVYEVKGGLVGGNIQIHPPNPGHPGFQSPLPEWVDLEP